MLRQEGRTKGMGTRKGGGRRISFHLDPVIAGKVHGFEFQVLGYPLGIPRNREKGLEIKQRYGAISYDSSVRQQLLFFSPRRDVYYVEGRI